MRVCALFHVLVIVYAFNILFRVLCVVCCTGF